jgi:hypothetical protein
MSKSNKKSITNSMGPKTKAVVLIGIIILALIGLYYYQNIYKHDINNNPEIIYTYPSGSNPNTYVSAGGVKPLNYISLIAGIIDKDGDPLMVSFWIKDNATAPWRGLALLQGNNGTYIYELPKAISLMPPRNYAIQWRIDVSDGHNVTSRTMTI